MRKLGSDETVKGSIIANVEENVVLATFKVKLDNSSVGEVFVAENYRIDFADVTMAELMVEASRPIIIKRQREFRDAEPSKRMSIIGKGVRVRVMLDEGRKAADPVTSARNKLDALDPAIREALLKEYAAEQEVSRADLDKNGDYIETGTDDD